MVLCALASLGGFELIGVTCVYGDVELRGKIVLSYLGNVAPVYLGESEPLSGVAPWHSGLEGSLLGDLSGYRAVDGAVDFLINKSFDFAGSLEILAIGPLTNIASSILRDASFPARVKALYVMGGDFAREFAEHNFKSDVKAAEVVFESGIRVDVMPLNITRQVAIEIEAFEFLGETNLGKEIRQWAAHKSLAFNNPHDLMALLMFAEPSLFELSGFGSVSVSDEGISKHRVSADGKQRVVLGLDVAEVRRRVLEVLGGEKR
jgi:inosine-uridine nucleoside N-ribohydrolase